MKHRIQSAARNRLAKDVVGSCVHPLLMLAACKAVAHRHKGDPLSWFLLAPDLEGCRDSSQLRHVTIQQHQVVTQQAVQFECFTAIASDVRTGSEALQDVDQGSLIRRIVVRYQDSEWARGLQLAGKDG